MIYRERKREEHISGLSNCVDGRVIREGFGVFTTSVLDRLDLRCLWDVQVEMLSRWLNN